MLPGINAGGIDGRKLRPSPEPVSRTSGGGSTRTRELNRLIDRSLAANNDLAAAKARVDTARALVGVDRARMFPTLDLNGSAGISRQSDDVVTDNIPPGFSVDLENQRYRGSFDLAYDPDLWGRNKRSLEAAEAEAARAEDLLDSQRLGLATEVCPPVFPAARTRRPDSRADRKPSRPARARFDIQKSKADAGLIDGLPPCQARTELELARNDLAAVERQRGSAEHALAVLCGTPPVRDFSVSHSADLGNLPAIRPGLPAEVLSRRPDVRAAEQNLRAANARIGVAEAAFYPNFSLTGGAGFESLKSSQFPRLGKPHPITWRRSRRPDLRRRLEQSQLRGRRQPPRRSARHL